jgi:hypothetical protein
VGPDGAFQTITFSGDAVFDPTTITKVRRRLNEIDDELEIAKDVGHTENVPDLEEEKSGLLTELQKNLSPAGRSRLLGSVTDKDRKAAWKRYNKALRYLKDKAPALAAHLETFIKSGDDFVYQNDTRWLT